MYWRFCDCTIVRTDLVRPSFVFNDSFSFFYVSFLLFCFMVGLWSCRPFQPLVQSSINKERYLKIMLRLEVWEKNHFLSHISIFFFSVVPSSLFLLASVNWFFSPYKWNCPISKFQIAQIELFVWRATNKNFVDCFPGFQLRSWNNVSVLL